MELRLHVAGVDLWSVIEAIVSRFVKSNVLLFGIRNPANSQQRPRMNP